MKIAIIGVGLIGRERIIALKKISELTHQPIELIAFDTNPESLISVKVEYNIKITNDFNKILSENPDWIFICTPHYVAKDIVLKSFGSSANILLEKPFGCNIQECDEILTAKPVSSKLYIGFNYRFFDGIAMAINDIKNGRFGKLISVNLLLGHGNSPGMEKSWKLDPIRCGGGCLIDPGIHILDLILQISKGEISICGVKSWSGFWNTGIEEEVHLCFSDDKKTIFNMQVSLNRWRSTFRMEINGTDGYGIVEGRGRSYGPQSYRTGKRWGWQNAKSQIDSENIEIASYDAEDSFLKEMVMLIMPELAERIFNHTIISKPCNSSQGREVMVLLDRCINLIK